MISKEIKQQIKQGIDSLYTADIPENLIQLQKTRPEFTGDVTLVVFPLLKTSKKGPEQTADEIGKVLCESLAEIVSYEIVKGFLNLKLSDAYFIEEFQKTGDPNYGKMAPKNETVMVEYASPNTNKPLHLGHIRNNLLGYSVAKILEANGYDVIKTQIINDRGVHICKSMLAWQKWGNGETPESTHTKGDHLVGKYYVLFGNKNKEEAKTLIQQGVKEDEAEHKTPLMNEVREMLKKWEDGDTATVELWKTMNSWVYAGFDKTYKTLGVDFDCLYYESNTYIHGKEIVDEGLSKGVFFKKEDGSVWCDLTNDGLDQKLLLRSDGTSVYMTQDLGTAVMRFKDYPKTSRQIYTVGNEQDYHFKVLFLILQKLGYHWAKNNYHLSYGMMELPTGKMKTREGTVVDADDLMDEMYATAKAITLELGKVDGVEEKEREKLFWNIGLSALKYFILKVEPKKKMLFNPEESIDFSGNTGPFIQYTYARARAIARKTEELMAGQSYSLEGVGLEPAEKEVIKTILEFPEAIEIAGKEYNPAQLANYLYELVKTYNHMYQTLPVLREENKHKQYLRIVLSKKMAEVVKLSLELLGIEAPERM